MSFYELNEIALETLELAHRPRERLGLCDRALREVKPPNSARRQGEFAITTTPHLREGMEEMLDPGLKEAVFIFPTGAGKTTLLDVLVPYCMTEEPGSILLTMQSIPEADAYYGERLEPILLNIDRIRSSLERIPKGKKKKGEIILPNLTLYVKGPAITTFQRKSVRYVFLDEAWMLGHGLIGEARARTHNRWNGRVVIVSQGGMASITRNGLIAQSELDEAWRQTDMREFAMVCPDCGEARRWHRSNLRWSDAHRVDGSIDEAAVFQSIRYVCPNCETQLEDNPQLRYRLSNESVYLPTNTGGKPGHCGWHAPAVSMQHEKWADLAIGWIKAITAYKRGDPEPKRIYIQKRDAENYEEEENLVSQSPMAVGDYSLSDYHDGQMWPGEAARFANIDVQRDHFWMVARAFKADGSSRLLWEGKVSTWEGCEELQRRLKIGEFDVAVDCSYDTDEVYNRCAKNRWIAMKGDQANDWEHQISKHRTERRCYSVFRRVAGTSGAPCVMMFWSNRQVKRIMEKLRSGYREPFEHPRDVSEDYKVSMFSEIEKDVLNKQTKRVERRFVVIGNRPNHKWDCECGILVLAIRKKLLAVSIADPPDASPANPSGEN